MGPKRPQIGSKWSKTAFMGIRCPQLVGTRWNEVGTGYTQLGLTTMTTLHQHKCPNWVSRRSQTGPKLGQNGPKQHLWGLGAPKWLEQGGTRLERGKVNWDWQLWPLYTTINAQIGSPGGPKQGPNGPKRNLWGSDGPRCPLMVGTRWNKVGMGYG